MNQFFKFATVGFSVILTMHLFSCSKDNDNPDQPNTNDVTVTIGFQNAPSQYFGGPTSYGANLYDGAEGQITSGYLAPLGHGKYAQFSINYGLNYNANFEMSWCYTLYNGGIALSDFHDMETDTYLNQLSVYDTTSPSGGKFAVANGLADLANPLQSKYAAFEGCGRVYITDENGYTVKNGMNKVTGEDEEGWFKSVWINNTTYTFSVIKNGNAFGTTPLKDKKGWFKVQFIAFEDDDENDLPVGMVEAYLANFDENLNIGYTGIIDEWIKVDLSPLPKASILVINFAGIDNDPIY